MFKKLLTLVATLTRLGALALMCAGAATIAHAQTKITYFHNDLAGSPVAASDSTGTIIWRESYRPYGEKLKNEAAGQSNSQWYTGHRQDAESGLVYMGARHYDPLIGRFLSIDPVGFSESNAHSFNRYAYANNNPIKFVDPDGRFAIAAEVAIGFGVAITVGYAVATDEQRNQFRQGVYDGFRKIRDKLSTLSNSSGGTESKAPTVQDNKADGDKARDEVAADLEAAGRGVKTEVRKKTPFGDRVIDIEVSNENGEVLGGVEVKKGGSRYRPDQRSKDEYLRGEGYPVDLVRKP